MSTLVSCVPRVSNDFFPSGCCVSLYGTWLTTRCVSSQVVLCRFPLYVIPLSVTTTRHACERTEALRITQTLASCSATEHPVSEDHRTHVRLCCHKIFSAQNRNCFHFRAILQSSCASTNDSKAWWCHGVSLFGEGSAPLDGAGCIATLELVKPKRAYHQSSRELQNWVVDCALLRLTRTLRRWLEENKKAGREPRDACDVLTPGLREKCDRVGEAGAPITACAMQPIFDREAEQRGMTRRFGTRWIRRRRKMDGCHGMRSKGPARTREDVPQHISIQQPLKQAMQFFAESVCRDEVVLDLRVGTTKRPHGICTPAQRWKQHEHHNESLAPPLLDMRGGTKACDESRSGAPQWHTLR